MNFNPIAIVFIAIYKSFESTSDITIIVKGNELDDPRSNPKCRSLRFTWC